MKSLENPADSVNSVATRDSRVTKPVAGSAADKSSMASTKPQLREARKIPADVTFEELQGIGTPTPAQIRVTQTGVDPADKRSSSPHVEPPSSPGGLKTAELAPEIQPQAVIEKKESKANDTQESKTQESEDDPLLALHKACDAMIRRGDYAAANNQIVAYRTKHPHFALTPRRDHQELLKLQKLVREKILASMPGTAGELTRESHRHEIAIADHDLMNAYRIDDKPNLARQYFLSAEARYTACLAAVEKLERAGMTPDITKEELQLITANLAELYTTWAEYQRETPSIRKAEELLGKSETLLPFADNQDTARAQIFQIRSRLKKLLQES